MSISDKINVCVALLTLVVIGFAYFHLRHANKVAKLERSYQLIDRYFTNYYNLFVGHRGILPLDHLFPTREEFTSFMAEREWRASMNRGYMILFFEELGKYWIDNSIDKKTIGNHLGREMIHRYWQMESEIRRRRETNPNYLFEWEIMVYQMQNPKIKFEFLVWLYRDIHGKNTGP